MKNTPAIGLALSGGGFRATTFGLGAMRALHDCGLLAQVRVVSGISGGSLLAAMWAYGPADFDDFDDDVTALVRRGLQGELVARALVPRRVINGMVGKVQALPGVPGRRLRAHARTEALVASGRGPSAPATSPMSPTPTWPRSSPQLT